jgi:hypothetical protein
VERRQRRGLAEARQGEEKLKDTKAAKDAYTKYLELVPGRQGRRGIRKKWEIVSNTR